MVEVYGGKKGDEVPFLGSESPSVTYLFRCLGETAVTIGLNHAVFGIWGIVQVLNYGEPTMLQVRCPPALNVQAACQAGEWLPCTQTPMS